MWPAALKLGGEAALQGFKTFFGREVLDGSASGAAALTAENVLPKAMAAVESRADTAAHNLALEHADDIARPHTPSPAAGTTDHPPPLTEHHTPLPPDTPGHRTSVDGRGHPGTSGSGDHPIANPAPDGLDHRTELGPQPPPTINDINKWLPEINHDPSGFDPLRAVNCGSCALAVDQRLTGQIPDATAGLGTLTIPEMEAATGLQQVPGTPSQIAQYLVDQGPGAHTVVGVDRANGEAGHWFNAYYDGNKVYALDAQTAQVLGWPPNMDIPGSPVTNWDYGVPKRLRPDQLALAADLMNVSKDVAAERARDVRDGIIRLSSPVRGLGSVLVGPDLSVLFYASYIGSEEALMEWDKGTRTPRESFNALHTLKDGTRRPQDER